MQNIAHMMSLPCPRRTTADMKRHQCQIKKLLLEISLIDTVLKRLYEIVEEFGVPERAKGKRLPFACCLPSAHAGTFKSPPSVQSSLKFLSLIIRWRYISTWYTLWCKIPYTITVRGSSRRNMFLRSRNPIQFDRY